MPLAPTALRSRVARRISAVATGVRVLWWRVRYRFASQRRTVIIAEPGRCHAEVILGLLDDLERAHLSVAVILNDGLRDSAAVSLAERGIPTVFIRNEFFPSALRSVASNRMTAVLMNSSWDYSRQVSIPSDWGRTLARRTNVCWILHDAAELESDHSLVELQRARRVAVLVANHPSDAPVVFPLGAFERGTRHRDGCSFLVPASTFQDYSLLLDGVEKACERLGSAGAFRVDITGRLKPKRFASVVDEIERRGLTESVRILGFLDDVRFAREVESADFLIGPVGTHPYEEGRHAVSGTRQLTLASLTPALVPEELLDTWGLSKDEVVSIEAGAVDSALVRAVQMSHDAYSALQDSLEVRRAAHSEANLRAFERLFGGWM